MVTGILRDLTVGLLTGLGIFRFFTGMAKITTPISTNQMAGFLKRGYEMCYIPPFSMLK